MLDKTQAKLNENQAIVRRMREENQAVHKVALISIIAKIRRTSNAIIKRMSFLIMLSSASQEWDTERLNAVCPLQESEWTSSMSVTGSDGGGGDQVWKSLKMDPLKGSKASRYDISAVTRRVRLIRGWHWHFSTHVVSEIAEVLNASYWLK
jgi:hypothetical protein